MSGTKTVLILGVSKGLGALTAVRLLESGWDVTGVSRSNPQEVRLPEKVRYLQADLSSIQDVAGLPERIGPCPDLILHNAVRYSDGGGVSMAIGEIEEVFRVNAIAPYHLMRGILQQKPAEKFCSCVIVNSEVIFHSDSKSGVYGASKAALRIFTSSLADWARTANASVSTLLLGPMADFKADDLRRISDRTGKSLDEVHRIFLKKSNPDLVIERLIEYEEAYRCVLQLAELGKSANGSMFRLDGGSAGSLI